jgi:hypothetical protein
MHIYMTFFHAFCYSSKTNGILPSESIVNCHQLSSIISLLTRDSTLIYRQTYSFRMDKTPQYAIGRILWKNNTKIIITQSVSLEKAEREKEKADCYVLSTYGHRLYDNLVRYYTCCIFTFIEKSLVYLEIIFQSFSFVYLFIF